MEGLGRCFTEGSFVDKQIVRREAAEHDLLNCSELLQRIANRGNGVAFLVHTRLVDAREQDITPVFWNDNYVTLLPGESIVLSARSDRTKANREGLAIAVDGWNLASITKVQVAPVQMLR